MERKREQEKANERKRKNLVFKNEKEPSGSSYAINQVPEWERPPKGWKRPPKGHRYRDPTCLCWDFSDANPAKFPEWCLFTTAGELFDGCWCMWKDYPIEPEQEDLLGYCRDWKNENAEQFWKRWIVHPQQRIRMDIFGELASYQSREAYTLEQQVNWVVNMWRHIQKIEDQRPAPFVSLCEAVRYLEREKIIALQDNI